MKKLLRKLQQDQLSVLKEHKGIQTFDREVDVLKNNEIPSAALVVLEGGADILKCNEAVIRVSPGYAIGLDDLWCSEPSSLHLRANPDLKAIILSKSDLGEDSRIFPIIHKLINAA
jgi:hypothetical protein